MKRDKSSIRLHAGPLVIHLPTDRVIYDAYVGG